ncbi:VTC domain protein [Caulifigura coniformis]|uniref:VTC domain protein n=1 Tax=Caulifigura coniformis TaxID=2527983 RepID=A0A517SIW2_9PLAN|nr:polyphosphate polymerase domain-containing protein [Caulifigura coniformis]QDT56052.1 VTC domain protein [Caulifigura coniformis]
MDSAFETVASDSWPVVTANDLGNWFPAVADHASPSPRPADHASPPSYELKYVLNEIDAVAVEQELSAWMTIDPHADPTLDRSYRISTVYADTPRFDVFHRATGHRRTKLRLRRYGDSSTIFLERKTKRGRQVSKERVQVGLKHLHRLASADPADWPGEDFRQELARRALLPVCAVSYLRRAYFGVTEEGRMRVTFDRGLQGQRVDDWTFAPALEGPGIAPDIVICEFKFRGAMPNAFKRAIARIQVFPGGFSKYRTCMKALGLQRREFLLEHEAIQGLRN